MPTRFFRHRFTDQQLQPGNLLDEKKKQNGRRSRDRRLTHVTNKQTKECTKNKNKQTSQSVVMTLLPASHMDASQNCCANATGRSLITSIQKKRGQHWKNGRPREKQVDNRNYTRPAISRCLKKKLLMCPPPGSRPYLVPYFFKWQRSAIN